jgi:hypothetical protein
MNAYITAQLTHQHQAELLREADNARLARLARYGGEVDFGGPVQQDPWERLALAVNGAAAAIRTAASTLVAAASH